MNFYRKGVNFFCRFWQFVFEKCFLLISELHLQSWPPLPWVPESRHRKCCQPCLWFHNRLRRRQQNRKSGTATGSATRARWSSKAATTSTRPAETARPGNLRRTTTAGRTWSFWSSFPSCSSSSTSATGRPFTSGDTAFRMTIRPSSWWTRKTKRIKDRNCFLTKTELKNVSKWKKNWNWTTFGIVSQQAKKLSNVYSENVFSGNVLKISFLFYLLII